eukprot:6209811-Pleurochrysis_carterae.AAC.2
MLADESDVKKPKLHHNMEQVTHQSAADGSWHVFPPVAKDNANGGTSQMGGSSRGISPGDNDGKSETSDFEKDFEDELFEELQACMEHSTPRVEDTSLPANAASEPDRLTSLPAELLARVLSWLPHTWLLGPARRISKVLTAVADAQAARLTQTKLKVRTEWSCPHVAAPSARISRRHRIPAARFYACEASVRARVAGGPRGRLRIRRTRRGPRADHRARGRVALSLARNLRSSKGLDMAITH